MKNHLLPLLLIFVITTSLCQAQNPILWGMTSDGGTSGNGTIFTTTVTGVETVQHDFTIINGQSPDGSLLQASNGLFYGMTSAGGTNGKGTIFRYDINTGSKKDIHDFGIGNDGQNPDGSFFQASNGLLYGMTSNGGNNNYGTIFSYNISTGIETVLHNFGNGTDGIRPFGSLLQANNGVLYGMTNQGGSNGFGIIFSYNISNSSYTDIHNFSGGTTDGSSPYGSLIQASNGLLYGTTYTGGTDNYGTIFNFNISNSSYSDIYNFNGGTTDGSSPNGSLIQVNNGLLYGMTWIGGSNNVGTIFSYNISTGKDSILHNFGNATDGAYPGSSLVQASNGLLYGVSGDGGTNGFGTIFSYNISTATETDLHDFHPITDGIYPQGQLIQANNNLIYGMTGEGGTDGYGTIFNYNISTDTETYIYDFASGADGIAPQGSLIQANNGLLYGMTTAGGTYGAGTIFNYNISIGKDSVLHDFGSGIDGENPNGSLFQASNGLLYGMTSEGGANFGGTIFSYNISTGIYSVLHDFGSGNDGTSPDGSLIQGSNGFLYGTTYTGGTDNYGTIFSYNISTGKDSVLHNFGSVTQDGTNPYGSLILGSDSILWGMTEYGGGYNSGGSGLTNSGVFFSYGYIAGLYNIRHNFGGKTTCCIYDGQYPFGSLLIASNGQFYGMTSSGGSNGDGIIFSSPAFSFNYTIINNFSGGTTDGSSPYGSLMQASNGLLYGMTKQGGTNNKGTFFEYNISSGVKTLLFNFGNGTDGQFPMGDLIEVDTPVSPPFSVWPGDANDDLIVNNYDLIPIGLYYGETGFTRDTITNSWDPHPSTNWGSYQSDGCDLKFVDCNGDGIINSNDTLAITLNYGLTHLYHSPRNASKERSGGVPLYFIADSSLYHSGSRIHVAVWLGNSTTQATNIYGLGYDISLDNSLMQSGTISFNYDNSFLGTKNSDALSLYYIGNDIETAVTRIDHRNKSGYGKIGDLYFTLSSTINNPKLLISFSSSQAVDSSGNILTIQPINDTLSVKTTTSINLLSINNNQVSIYPNPTSGQFTIKSEGNQNGYMVEVFNLMGQQVYQSVLTNSQEVINLSAQPDGMYFVYLKSSNDIEVGKVLLAR